VRTKEIVKQEMESVWEQIKPGSIPNPNHLQLMALYVELLEEYKNLK